MKQCDVTIQQVRNLSPDIIRLTLYAPRITEEAKPGQFITIKAGDTYDPIIRRPFSIHQIHDDGRLEIVFKVLGKGTKILAATQQGQKLNLIGPLGNPFTITKNMCLIGGGMGIVPLLFLAKAIRKQEGISAKITVILAARNQEDLSCFTDDFNSLGVMLHLATDDGSLGHHGLVTDLIPTILDSLPTCQVCACGPQPMLQAIAKICEIHDTPCQVSLETMMACGISACLGCAIEAQDGKKGQKYLHVCQDGPVFWAGDIKWTA